MRTLELLRALSDREIVEMDQLIVTQKRKNLHVLYKELKKYRKHSGIPANEELYQSIYDKEYSSDKSYLLRNELRLLNEVLYDFLIEKTFKEYVKKHKSTYSYWLSRSLFDRKVNNVFSAEIDRFIDNARNYIKPDDGALMLGLKNLWMIYHLPKTVENLEQQQFTLQQWKKEQLRAWRYQLREMEAREAYLERTLSAIQGVNVSDTMDWRTPAQTVVHLNEGAGEDIIEEYIILKKHSHQTKGSERVKVMQRMLEIERSDAYKSEYSVISSQLASLNNIAIEYILAGKFEQADTYLKESIALSEANGLTILSATMQNYVCNKLNTGDYKGAIQFYIDKEDAIKQGRQYVPTLMGKIYCHLFLGQADDALESLPQNEQLTAIQHLQQRMVYVVAFIIRKQHDLAINECNNILRMLKANEGTYYSSYIWIVNLFLRYLNADTKPRTARRAELESIGQELSADSENVKQLTITEFSLRWLLLRVS